MNQAFNSNKVVPDTNLMPRNTESARDVAP